jgi:cytochrome o ubiquinol oxidase subunit 2
LLDSGVKPVTIQVVALDWKWLFIYPDSGVATVNYLRIPDKTPINFEVTSDAPMNSFWIPQLGGQIYAMPGMSTQLHLMANGAGSYNGVSANISGLGFSGMNFVTTSSSANDYTAWLMTAQKSSQHLSMDSYMDLAKPSQNNATTTYSQTMHGLYDIVVNGSMGQMMGMGM